MTEYNKIENNKNDKKYLSISEFTKIIKNNLESSYPIVFLRGEVSNFRPSSSGHIYFNLKDITSSIKAIIFKNIYNSLKNNNSIEIKDGQEVLVEGRLSVYEKNGEYSIIVSRIILAGIGELSIKFDFLKEKLAKEGLFDVSIKKQIPNFPHHIGIVTSPTGAALKDILNILKRRNPSIKITVFPTSVQGDNAKFEIVNAIKCANYHFIKKTKYKVDTLIIARGGGSIEDLWPFNEEIVAYAIHKCKIPIITGIGHEIDFTIADFCADFRAPTPSAAAELVVKNIDDVMETIYSYVFRMQGSINNNLEKYFLRYEKCNSARITNLFNRIYLNYVQNYSYSYDKLIKTFFEYYNNFKHKFFLITQKFNNLSPLNTLLRGYSLTYTSDHKLVTEYNQLNIDDDLYIMLSRGGLMVNVKEILKSNYFELTKNKT